MVDGLINVIEILMQFVSSQPVLVPVLLLNPHGSKRGDGQLNDHRWCGTWDITPRNSNTC